MADPWQHANVSPKTSERRKIRIVTVVWGAAYVSKMISIAWRTILSPNNLPALAENFDLSYTLYMSSEDRATVTDSAQLELIRRYTEVDIKPFSTSDMHQDRYEWHWTLWKNECARAREEGAIVLLIIPDVLYSDGTLARWGDLLKRGYRAIFSIGTWISQETFIPEFDKRYPLAHHDVIALSREEMIADTLTHVHPLIAASARTSGHGIFHAERITEIVPGEGFESRMLSSQPFVFDPRHFRLDNSHCPLNHLKDVTFDDVCIVSPGPMLHLAEFYQRKIPFDDVRILNLSGWASGNLRAIHYFESQFGYHYPRYQPPRDASLWEQSAATLDKMRRHILATHSIAKLCEFAVRMDCGMAAGMLAIALMRCGLNRQVDIDRAFTAYLPVNKAFFGWADSLIAPLFSRAEAADIIRIAKAHLVPGIVRLRKGDEVPLSARCSDVAAVLAAQRLPFPKYRPKVVSGPHRVMFGLVYLVDAIAASVGR